MSSRYCAGDDSDSGSERIDAFRRSSRRRQSSNISITLDNDQLVSSIRARSPSPVSIKLSLSPTNAVRRSASPAHSPVRETSSSLKQQRYRDYLDSLLAQVTRPTTPPRRHSFGPSATITCSSPRSTVAIELNSPTRYQPSASYTSTRSTVPLSSSQLLVTDADWGSARRMAYRFAENDLSRDWRERFEDERRRTEDQEKIIGDLQADIRQLHSDIRSMRSKMANNDSDRQNARELQNQLASQSTEMDELERLISRQNSEIRQLRRDLEQEKTASMIIGNQHSKANTDELRALQHEINEDYAEIHRLKGLLQDNDRQHSDTKDDMLSLHAKLKAIDSQRDEAARKQEQVQRELQRLQSELAARTNGVESLKHLLAASEAVVAERDRTIELVRAQCREANQTIQSKSTELNAIKFQLATVADKDRECTALKDTVAELEAKLAAANAVTDQLHNDLNASKCELRRRSMTVNNMLNTSPDVRTLSDQLERLRDDNQYQQSVIDRMNSEVAQVSTDRDRTVAALRLQHEEMERDHLIEIERMREEEALERSQWQQSLATAEDNAAKYRDEAHKGREKIVVLERERHAKAQHDRDNQRDGDDLQSQLTQARDSIRELKAVIDRHGNDRSEWQRQVNEARIVNVHAVRDGTIHYEQWNEREAVISSQARALMLAGVRAHELEAMIECQAWAMESLIQHQDDTTKAQQSTTVSVTNTNNFTEIESQQRRLVKGDKSAKYEESKVNDSDEFGRTRALSGEEKKIVRGPSVAGSQQRPITIGLYDDRRNILNYDSIFEDSPMPQSPLSPASPSTAAHNQQRRSSIHQRSASLQVPSSSSVFMPTFSSERRELVTAVRRHVVQGQPLSPHHQRQLSAAEESRITNEDLDEDGDASFLS